MSANVRFYIALIPLLLFWAALWCVWIFEKQAMELSLWMMANRLDTGPPEEYMHDYLALGYPPIALAFMLFAAQPIIHRVKLLREDFKTIPEGEAALSKIFLTGRWLRIVLLPAMAVPAMAASPMPYANFGDPAGIIAVWMVIYLPSSLAIAALMTRYALQGDKWFIPLFISAMFLELMALPLFHMPILLGVMMFLISPLLCLRALIWTMGRMGLIAPRPPGPAIEVIGEYGERRSGF